MTHPITPSSPQEPEHTHVTHIGGAYCIECGQHIESPPLRIVEQFPGLPVRSIGPGDDVVVSAEQLEKWLLDQCNKSPQQVAGDEELADKIYNICLFQRYTDNPQKTARNQSQSIMLAFAASNKQVELKARIDEAKEIRTHIADLKPQVYFALQRIDGHIEQLEAELAALTNKQEEKT